MSSRLYQAALQVLSLSRTQGVEDIEWENAIEELDAALSEEGDA